MYRDKIREYYDHLSRSYRRVADYILSNYYEVSFMTAAQLAYAVRVDTTTVVRFSQRLGYNGYPELLADIREQVRAEIYAHYEPPTLPADDPAALFKARIEGERANLDQVLVHSPPEHVRKAAELLAQARQIVLIAEGYGEPLARLAAEQLRHRGVAAAAAGTDPATLAGVLVNLGPGTLVIGISPTAQGRTAARAMQYARARGCATLAVAGSLASPVNRMADLTIYAPSDTAGPLPSLVALAAALGALGLVTRAEPLETTERAAESMAQAYEFLLLPDSDVPEEEE
jgi:DNA-binding MurR/RpiR family transcriptional regulator